MEKFKNKYRISSARLQSWDYGWDGAYFITICTHNRKHYFGEIIDDKIQLSQIGVIADILWYEIKNHTNNIELNEFVVMPNHIHGILILNDKNGDGRDKACLVSTANTTNTADMTNIGQKRFQNQGKNTISSIVGSYKSAVTKHTRRLGYEFAWQSRFYDHIIRDEKSFNRIQNYIVNNPVNWVDDNFYKREK